MLTRFLILISFLLVLVGCARHHPHLPLIQNKALTRSMPVFNFNKVNVEGLINVKLATGYKSPGLDLIGDPRDLDKVVTEVKNNALFVRVNKGAPRFGPLTIKIRASHLNSFSYQGAGTIVGKNLHSSLLDLDINNSEQTTLGGSIVLRKLVAAGNGQVIVKGIKSRYLQLDIKDKTKVMLVGQMHLSKLDMKGDGWLTMYWIKSPSLVICAKGRSNIQLAGLVDKLDVELWGSARFKGRYLRAQNAFVKTHERSFAEIAAIKHQHAFATDVSDIYFYRIPQTKADFMAFQGSILDMRDLNLPDLQEYTRYNKETH